MCIYTYIFKLEFWNIRIKTWGENDIVNNLKSVIKLSLSQILNIQKIKIYMYVLII